jgi:type IV pilus assembly protein PilV
MRQHHKNACSPGFSLIEVMVALVVICVGLLGIAKMQALALSNTTTSRMRSLAALEAASLAAAMHSNRQYWANTPPVSITLNVRAIASTDGALAAQATADLGNLTACVGNNSGVAQCTAPNLAAYDLANWTNDLNNLLPNPTANIACPPVAGGNIPTSCTIQISWTERAIAANQQEAAVTTGQFETPTYTLYVEP